MAAVLAVQPFWQVEDANGIPIAGGTIDTYAAGTTTRKATYTDASATVQATNPVVLDSAGRATIWISGSYKFVVKDALGNVIRTTDNISSFTIATSTATSYSQTFSGNGSQTAFTTSQNLGTDSNALQVFVNNTPSVTNTPFFQAINSTATQTVFTASQNLGTDPKAIRLFKNTTSLGFQVLQPATDYTVNGTTITLTTGLATFAPGLLVFENPVLGDTSTGVGFQVLPPSAYTINGTALSLAVAPKTGTNNILVMAPAASAVGAASVSAAAADTSATSAGNSAASAAISASSAAAYAAAKNQWTFSSTTTMANPGTGLLRLNNTTPASVTAMAISNLSANSGNPDLSGWISTWDDSGSTIKGSVYIFKDNGNFAIYGINGVNVDNTGWKQISLTLQSQAGSFTNNDALLIGFTANGSTTVTGGITALTGDVTASGSGSVPATIKSSVTLITPILGVATATSINFGQSALSYYGELIPFTPSIRGSSTAGTPTYVAQTGSYTRAGNLVYVTIQIAISAIGGMSGRLQITGLPFTANASLSSQGLSVTYDAATAAATYVYRPLISATTVDLFKAASGGSVDFTQADITASFQIRLGGVYQV